MISGYLITLLLISEKERTSTVDMKQFWFRRARRLLPALFTMLIALVDLDRALRPRCARQAPRRRHRRAALRLELVPDLDGSRLHRGQRVRTAASPLEPRRRGTVLRRLAARDVRAAARRHPADRRHQPLAGRDRARHHGLRPALVYTSGPIGTPEVTPDAYWSVAGREISKFDWSYLGTFSRAAGLLLGAAFAMVWRPVAVMRGPLRTKGPLLDVVGARRSADPRRDDRGGCG